MYLQTAATRTELENLLAADVPYGDLTTDALGIRDQPGTMTFTAREPMVLALAEDAAVIIELTGCHVTLHVRSGAALEADTAILTARGVAGGLLKSWKVAQTLIEIWAGVATATRAIVTAATAVSPEIAVACTRKNTPGTKTFATAAVRAGGAGMHRLGLSETVLVFPEHRIFLGDQPLAVSIAQLRRTVPEKKLVIEVSTIDAALAAAEAGIDVVQTEKFSPDLVAALVERLAKTTWRPLIAAAGGINANNAGAYARAGANIIVTSSPYTAGPRDVQVSFANG
ncbi:ModD protein [Microbacteriaceae bacterium K1510]|nr:ModD protein [Microbacteriaceae bacterium K1510]